MPKRRKSGERSNPYTPTSDSWPKYEVRVAPCHLKHHLMWCVYGWTKQPGELPKTFKIGGYATQHVLSEDAIRAAKQYAKDFSTANPRNPNPARVLDERGRCVNAFLNGKAIGCENPLPRIPRWQEIPKKTKLIAAGAAIAGIGAIILFAKSRKQQITSSRFGRDVLARAQQDVGVTEVDGSGRVERMLLTYGITYPVNWCAVATGTWIHEAAQDFSVKPPIQGSPGAKDTMLQFQNASNKKVDWIDANTLRRYPELVQPGMISVWQRGPVASYMGHIGVVEANLGSGSFQTIEGNAGPSAGAVVRGRRELSADNFLGMGYFNDAEVFNPEQAGVAGVGLGAPPDKPKSIGFPTYDTWWRAIGGPSGMPYEPTDYVVTFDNGSSVETEVVRTPQHQARGLMHRQSMPEDRGMLFVYATSSKRSLWMRNTFIPLDGVFMDGHGVVVGIVENLVPRSDEIRGVDKPVKYILETNAGWAKRHGVRVGSRMMPVRVGVGFTQDPPNIMKFEPVCPATNNSIGLRH